MGPDQDPNQKPPAPVENPDYKFPSGSPESGAVGMVAGAAGMLGGVPLVGSFLNEGWAFADAGTALYHGMKAKDAYNSGNQGEGSKQMDQADSDLDHATGHLINAIPLVGFARSWM